MYAEFNCVDDNDNDDNDDYDRTDPLPLAQSRGVKMEGKIGLSTRDYTHLAARCSVGIKVGLKPARCAPSNQLENSNSLLFCLFSQ